MTARLTRIASILVGLTLLASACTGGSAEITLESESESTAQPTAEPVEPTSAPEPTAEPESTSSETADDLDEAELAEQRQAAIAEVMALSESVDASLAECLVDAAFETYGTYDLDDKDASLAAEAGVECATQAILPIETLVASAVEAGFTGDEAECLAAKAAEALGEDFDITRLEDQENELAMATAMNACADPIGGATGDPAPGDNAELDELWQTCSDGVAEDCALLQALAGADSEYEKFGTSCGGRVVIETDCGLWIDGERLDTENPYDLDEIPDPGSAPPGEDAALDALWEACSAEDADACDQLFFDAPTNSVYESYGYTCGGRVNNQPCQSFFGGGDTDDNSGLDDVPDPGSPAPGEDAELDALWEACSAEDGDACDALFVEAPVDSVYEAFGLTCGGRTLELDCNALFGTVSESDPAYDLDEVPDPGSPAPGEDAELDALWQACSDKDADACDQLYFDAPVDSEYEAYGYTCGGRAAEEDCADLFAEG